MKRIAIGFILFLCFASIAFAQSQENKYVVTITYHIKQPEQSTNQDISGDEYIVTINWTYTSSHNVSGRYTERKEVAQETVRAKSKEEAERVVSEKWKRKFNESNGNNGTLILANYVNTVSAVKMEPPAVSNLKSNYNIVASTAAEAEEKAIKQWEALKEEQWVFDFANAEFAN